MNDLISRKAAIDAVKKNTFRLTFAEEQNYEGHVAWSANAVYSDVIEGKLLELPSAQPTDCDKLAIETVPSVTPKHYWIPCSERLPYAEYGESDTVLATCGYWEVKDESIRWIRMLYYNGGNWCFLTGEAYSGKVYAWMPLPEPYREEGDE